MIAYYKHFLNKVTQYLPVHIFTSDTPSAKEKKAEKRCQDVVDMYYTYKVNTTLRESLHAVETNFLLLCNNIALEDTYASCGRLQALLEEHQKTILKLVKREKHLSDYYNEIALTGEEFKNCNDYITWLVLDQYISNDFTKDFSEFQNNIAVYKKVYYDAYKSAKQEYKTLTK